MGTAGTVAKFDGVKTRLLEDHERPFGTMDRGLPLVIEPGGASTPSALNGLLSSRSREIKEALYDHGALLFRGFAVSSEHEFEAAIKSLQGVRPLERYFMAEEGRELAGGTKSVFVTNNIYKTGGTFSFNGFHSENFYTTDVPALQSFWCKTAPWLGGESGLIHMGNGFAELPADLQAKLERQPVSSRSWTLAEVARDYGLPEERVEAFFRELGMSGALPDGTKVIAVHKPVVYRHPHHGKRALQINLGGELGTAMGLLNRLLKQHYTGPKWALHRYAWDHAFMHDLFETIERLPLAFAHPEVVGKREWESVKGLAKGVGARFGLKTKPSSRRAPEHSPMMGRAYQPPMGLRKLADLVTPEESVTLAKVARRHCSVFTWKQGDVLLFDNLQVLHAGMPGLGPREIRVMMCNPIPMKYPFRSGLIEVAFDEGYRSIDERLLALKDERSAQGARPGSIAAS